MAWARGAPSSRSPMRRAWAGFESSDSSSAGSSTPLQYPALVRLALVKASALEARAYYDHRRAQGDSHHEPLRALANRLVGILHGCFEHRTLYDEHTAWGHRHDQHRRLTPTDPGVSEPTWGRHESPPAPQEREPR